jgi:3-oxoacyl-[acyl-carrier-protein] synthase II
MSNTNNRRVVVTGMGAVTPLGLSVDEFWNSMMNGESGCDYIKNFDASRCETKFACELKGFDPGNYMDKKQARRLDQFSQYALAASKMALQDSGLKPEEMPVEEKERTGVIFGSGIGGFNTFYKQAVINHTQGPDRVSPFFIPMMIPNIAAGLISIEYGFLGPNHCVVTACATANNNLIDGYMLIRNNLADRILAGGVRQEYLK